MSLVKRMVIPELVQFGADVRPRGFHRPHVDGIDAADLDVPSANGSTSRSARAAQKMYRSAACSRGDRLRMVNKIVQSGQPGLRWLYPAGGGQREQALLAGSQASSLTPRSRSHSVQARSRIPGGGVETTRPRP